jgi:hypothetical protein
MTKPTTTVHLSVDGDARARRAGGGRALIFGRRDLTQLRLQCLDDCSPSEGAPKGIDLRPVWVSRNSNLVARALVRMASRTD